MLEKGGGGLEAKIPTTILLPFERKIIFIVGNNSAHFCDPAIRIRFEGHIVGYS